MEGSSLLIEERNPQPKHTIVYAGHNDEGTIDG
jgi:hypothetical protein